MERLSGAELQHVVNNLHQLKIPQNIFGISQLYALKEILLSQDGPPLFLKIAFRLVL
jgi:hypothetical protein